MNSLQQFVAQLFGIDKYYLNVIEAIGVSHDYLAKRWVERASKLESVVSDLEAENENLRRTNEILADTNRDLIAAAKARNERMEVLLGKTAA